MYTITPFIAFLASYQEPVKLRVVVKPNARYEYSLSASLTINDAANRANNGSVRFDIQYAERVLTVEAGKVTWSSFIAAFKTAGTGSQKRDTSYPKMQGTTIVSSTDFLGNMDKPRNVDNEFSYRRTCQVIFPEDEVAVGAKWYGNGDMGGKTLRFGFHFDGWDKIDGLPVAKITRTFPESAGIKELEPTVVYIDPSDGLIVRATGKYEEARDKTTYTVDFKLQRLTKKL